LDIEWLLSTLFDASLFNYRAAGNGGSFLCPISGHLDHCSDLRNRRDRRGRGMFAVRARSGPRSNYVCRFIFPALDNVADCGQF
jgi:hypothetical protein